MDKIKEHLTGTNFGFILTLGGVAWQYPDTLKYLGLSIIYLFVIHKGINNNFSKITGAIDKLTDTMASLEKNHSDRLNRIEFQQEETKSKVIELSDKVKKIELNKPKEV